MDMRRHFRRLGSTVPRSSISFFEKKLNHAGVRYDVRIWIGERLLLALFIAVLSLATYIIVNRPELDIMSFLISSSLFIYGLLATLALFYLSLYFQIADRASKVEAILPDFLLLTVSNLRAGMTPYSAFLSAAKPEFGALYEEVRMSTSKGGGTASLIDNLNEISIYFDSQILRRTVNLFAKGIRSGGQLAKLLKESADEVQKIRDLRAELATATRTYAIFLGFILIIVMPFLLSVSTQFITIFLALQPETNVLELEGAGDIPSFSGTVLITPEDMVAIAVITLGLTSLLVSGLLGIIIRGKALYGIKYFPVFAIASVVFYFIAREVISGMFSAFSI
jgi:pilus assembly protein TadC